MDVEFGARDGRTLALPRIAIPGKGQAGMAPGGAGSSLKKPKKPAFACGYGPAGGGVP